MTSEYMNFVMEALELEDTLKNYERRDASGWFALSFQACFSSHCVSLSKT